MAVHEIIKKLREEFTKETTLPHSRPGQGHTQYYAEHVEIKYMEQQAEIERLKGENALLINCENCRHEPCDHNSECDSCQSLSRWQSNFVSLPKAPEVGR
jgi:hypothetical protein